ncbi:MAG: homoserine dehydrogenase [Myxococcales bacterium]|nr:homoserine dehydrogenase [Myxococcales bacterium]
MIVATPSNLPRAVHGIYALIRQGHQVVASSEQPGALAAALREAGLGPACVEVVPHASGAQPLPIVEPQRRLRVALLGHGTVGTGLYRRLAELPDQFTVTAIAVRDVRKAERNGAPARLLHNECRLALSRPHDVVVELIGGTLPAASLIESSLRARKHVVTANKAVIAGRGPYLEVLAREAGVQLLYSASVGGAMPALETLRRHAGSVVAFSGVLNATSNFVLDRMAAGLALNEAVAQAQAAGYAEADPRLDLDGTDAAQKLVILARAAFGCVPQRLVQEGIEHVRDARGVRLVASCTAGAGEVRPVALAAGHPLASTAGAENRLLIQLRDGSTLSLSATGAGRWPTAEAVLADLYDVAGRAGLRPQTSGLGHAVGA